MFYKIISFVLVFTSEFLFENVFAATIFISPREVNIKQYCNGYSFNTYAELIVKQHWTKKEVFQVKRKNTKIFAEIYINYNDNEDNKFPSLIKLRINFEEKKIVVTKENKQCYFSYNENGIHDLETYISSLHNKIIFEVVRIYNGNLESNSTVYNYDIKYQLDNIQFSSLWNYIKEDLVELNSLNISHITIEDLLNNSTMLKKTVREFLREAKTIMVNRTTKYVLLLTVFTYKILKIDDCFVFNPFWIELIKYFKKLDEAINKLFTNNTISYLIINFISKIYINEKTDTLIRLANKCTHILNTSKQLNDHNSENSEISNTLISNDINYYYLLNNILKDFPKPHNFEDIPDTLEKLKKKLKIIFKLIEAEYENIL
ncbi:uncharacterized protein LOC126906593 isoform X2 [Daktulosphaira vitifoliae]|uniref:uncharacterized protein LOC126906593 isoform X2 n=1 Tax=Daktulosphaira vitifoliae TaxID=58002 RepID=UPI0021A9C5F4|nr:uncharacterized protein LOC126906593 isoform X2 [Daktulosphaira vitifoliae]